MRGEHHMGLVSVSVPSSPSAVSPLLRPHCRRPDGRRQPVSRAGPGRLQGEEVRTGEGSLPAARAPERAPRGTLTRDCKRLKLAPVFTFVGGHAA